MSEFATDPKVSSRRVWYVFPYAGAPGLGRFTRPYDLAREWRKLGVDTTVFLSAHHHALYQPANALPAEFAIEGVSFRAVAGRTYSGNGLGRLRHMLGFGWKLRAAMREEARRSGTPTEIIVSSPHPFPIFAAAQAARRHAAKLVFEVRDVWPFALRETFGVSKLHPLYLLLALVERFAYRRSDAVVSLLPAAHTHMVERGMALAKFHVIPNGAPDVSAGGTGNLPGTVVEWMEAQKAAGRRIVGYAGSFGVPYATTSFRDVYERLAADAQTSKRLAFVFAGDGAERAELMRGMEKVFADRNGSPFLFLGEVTREAAGELLAHCQGGLVFTRDTPLFKHGIAMNKLAEYMRVGLPILAAYEAGNDPVTEARCGWRMRPEAAGDFASALTEFANMPASELSALGSNGRRYFLENFDYAAIAGKYLALFRRLAGPSVG